jgi:Flp pilus assembly protein TadD
LLYESKAYIHLEQFTAAESALRGYLLAHAASGDALYLLGYVLHREGKATESLETYTKAAQHRTPTGDDLKIVGLNYVLLNDYPDAIKWLEKAVEAEPDNKEAWYFLGRAYYTKSRVSEARKAFLKVLQLDPRDAKAENNLGLILESEAQPDAAGDAYRKAIEWQDQNLRPSEQPYLNLGSLLMEQSRVSESIPLLQKAVELAPENAICRMKMGTAYLRVGKLTDAQRDLEKAVQLAPDDPAAHYQLGKLYKEMKALDRAKAEFDRTAELQSRAASTKPQ